MTSHSAEICFHLWKLALFSSATLVQCADTQCEIQIALLKITLKLLNLKSLGIIGHILEVCCIFTVEIPEEGCTCNAQQQVLLTALRFLGVLMQTRKLLENAWLLQFSVSMVLIVARLPAAAVPCVSASVSCSDLSFLSILIYDVQMEGKSEFC